MRVNSQPKTLQDRHESSDRIYSKHVIDITSLSFDEAEKDGGRTEPPSSGDKAGWMRERGELGGRRKKGELGWSEGKEIQGESWGERVREVDGGRREGMDKEEHEMERLALVIRSRMVVFESRMLNERWCTQCVSKFLGSARVVEIEIRGRVVPLRSLHSKT